ncbi:MAG TPA: S9 family peptidase, partial [Acidimicrobiales bacterium]|nr:S9 family peptidase [Acidimicrobiales bacterium]
MHDSQPQPPTAERRPHVIEAHGDQRTDDWYWLRDREDPAVLAHLEAENAHTKAMLASTEPLQQELFDEIVARIQETDLSVPVRKGDYWYYSRTVEGLQYPIACRRRGAEDGPEQVLLDENELAEGHDFLAVANDAVSPDHNLLAYAVDTDGGERYGLRFRDLATDDDLADLVEDTYYGLAWTTDNAHVFYTKVDEAMRPFQLWRHRVGSKADDDTLVFQEDDDRFFLDVGLTRSEGYVVLTLESKVTTEVWVLPAGEPVGEFRIVAPREQGVEYHVDHQGDRFLIVTNADGAENFKLVEAPVDAPGKENWVDVVPHRERVKLDGVDVFARHVVLVEREAGLRQLRVLRVAEGDQHVIEMPEPVYTVGPDANAEFDTDTYRFGYESLVTPRSVYDYDVQARTRVLRKQQPVLGGYDPAQYETRRLWATAPDGVQVPISLVARRDVTTPAPTLLYGYGSYEISVEPRFSSLRLSLLDRGFVYAIAHIRGGGEMGRRWYDDGKFLAKRNTFTDFIACAEELIASGCTSADRLVAMGGSAGGLLMGAVINDRPDLFAGVLALVPFVDVVTTMLDETIPLTVGEFEEWGNPKDA